MFARCSKHGRRMSWPALYGELEVLDPLAASRMEATNARRVVRALEVTLGAGRRSPPTVRVSSPTVVRESCKLRCRVISSSWTCASRIVFARDGPGTTRRSDRARQCARRPEPHGAPAVGYRELLRHVEEGAISRRASRTRSSRADDCPSTTLVVPARPSNRVVDDAHEARLRLLGVLNGPTGSCETRRNGLAISPKWHGAGNDFLVEVSEHGTAPWWDAERARAVCDRTTARRRRTPARDLGL